MSLELYNMTKDTKTVPKFRYNGKYVIPSHGTVDINEDTAFFFKPYASIGIVVRQKQVEDSTSFESIDVEEVKAEPIEEETLEKVTVEEVKEEEVEDTSEEIVEATESVEEVKTEEIAEEVSSESVDSVYSEEELSTKNYKSLKKIATDLGLETDGVNKKADLISLIIGSQK